MRVFQFAASGINDGRGPVSNIPWIFSLIIGISVCFFTSCKKEKDDSGSGRINKVLILGNSLTQHGPEPGMGWYGNWGMAASSEENDFVHLLIQKFHTYDKYVNVKYGNIAENFEKKFWNFDSLDFKIYKDFAADLIIIRLGENVNDSYANYYGLNTYLLYLIDYLRKDPGVVICCTSSFWPNTNIDDQIENLCLNNGFLFVSLSGLYIDKTNTAIDEFDNPVVGAHPSDKGMKSIANRIWAEVNIFFI